MQLFKKVKPNKRAIYKYKNHVGQGSQNPFIIQRLDNSDNARATRKQYVAKPAGGLYENEIYSDDRVLQEIARANGLKDLSKDDWKIASLLEPYNEQEFKTASEMFCGEFIRLIAPLCTSKHRIFALATDEEDSNLSNCNNNSDSDGDEDNNLSNRNNNSGSDNNSSDDDNDNTYIDEDEISGRIFIGSEKITDYYDWGNIYKQGEDKINNCNVTSLGHINIDSSHGILPIVGIGKIAVLRYLLGLDDMHHFNWGLKMNENACQAIIFDFDACLTSFRFLEDKIHSEDILDPFDITKILEKVLEREKDCAPLHPAIHRSESTKLEIYDTISKLNTHFDRIVKLADDVFDKFPHHKKLILKELKNGITYLNNVANQAKMLEHKESPNYSIDTSPSYTLFDGNNKTMEDYKIGINEFGKRFRQ